MSSQIPGHLARIFVGGWDMSAQSSGANMDASYNVLSYNIMGQSAAQQDITTGKFSITHNGYFTGVPATPDGYLEPEMYSALGTTNPEIVTLVVGPVSYTGAAWANQFTVNAPVAEFITIEGNWSVQENLIRGTSLGPFVMSGPGSVNSAAVNLDTVDFTSAYVHVSGQFDLSGGNYVTVNMQSSTTEGGTYTTFDTLQYQEPLALVTDSAPTAGRRWIRFSVVFPGVFAGPITIVANLIR